MRMNSDLEREPWRGLKNSYTFKWPATKNGKDTGTPIEQDERDKKTRKAYTENKELYYPRCMLSNSTTAPEPPAKEHEPECACCKDTPCSNGMIIWALALMSLGWAVCVVSENNEQGENVLGAVEAIENLARDEDIFTFTKTLCDATPHLHFYAECYHTVTTGSGKNKSTKRVVTHTGNKAWAPAGLRSTELAGLPLRPERPFGPSGAVHIPWTDFNGRQHVTESSNGIVEVRAPELRISFATRELEDSFAASYASFKASNKKDTSQSYWIVTSLQGRPDPSLKVFRLAGSGATNPCYYTPLLPSLLGLGWMYQMWCVRSSSLNPHATCID